MEGVVIHCIGIGSPSGAPIPLPNGGFKEDKQGHKVMSKVDYMTLQQVALETNGKAVLASSSGSEEINTIYNDIQGMQKREIESKMQTSYEDRFQYFLLPAILILIVITLLPERSLRRTRKGKFQEQ